ncbi:MAG TPA: hypothetical protein VEB18_04080 [Candidatus Paceibacterota bacterium]|nr:hypothetical protein [Candidatus Paceibacterota bacterium]
MRKPDLDRERSEKKLSARDFLTVYNDGLPSQFPKASAPLLRRFSERHPELFKQSAEWSLDVHRKRFMDWLPNYLRENPPSE